MPPRPKPTKKRSSPPRLLIQSSAIHAAGCITLDPIRRGQRVLEYDGPRLSKGLADIRYAGQSFDVATLKALGLGCPDTKAEAGLTGE